MFFPGFDPSKMDPKLLMELSDLIRELPPEQLNRMQSLMHNLHAGFDVSREMEEFERSLPAGFREKLLRIVSAQAAAAAGAAAPAPRSEPETSEASPGGGAMDVREARLTILRGVAEGRLSPEEAERLLFGS